MTCCWAGLSATLAGFTLSAPGDVGAAGLGGGDGTGDPDGAGVTCSASSAAEKTWAKITPVAFETPGGHSSFFDCEMQQDDATTVPARRYLDEFSPGDRFESPAYLVSGDEARAFAQAYDPQPFHLDDRAAGTSIFGRVVISGWHTAAITMRLVVESGVMRAIGVIGVGIDELRWTAPVEAGASLFVRGTVVECVRRPGKSRGTLRVRLLTIDQNGTTVMSQIANLIVPQR